MERKSAALRLCVVASLAVIFPACSDGDLSVHPLDLLVPTEALGPATDVQVTAWAGPDEPNVAIVFLHGVGGSENTWAQLDGNNALSSVLAARGLQHLRPVVLAVRGDSLGWPEYLDGTISWRRFLEEELPAAIRSSFSEGVTPDRIAYLGASAGGAKAIGMAFARPRGFSCVAAHSPAIHPPDLERVPAWAQGWEGWEPLYGFPVDEALWRASNAIHLAATIDPQELDHLKIYFDVGNEDHLGFDRSAAELSATLAGRGMPHEFALRAGGHGDAFTSANLTHSLSFLVGCLSERLAD